jgi:replicative DNA helicase
MDLLERLPPQNLDAEASVLGSILLDNEAAWLVAQFLKPEHFYKSSNQKIYETILSLATERKPIDILILKDELAKAGLLESVGGAEYLREVVEAVPSAANAEHYARVVRDKALLRSLITVATTIAKDAYGANGAAEGVIDRAEKAFFDVTSRRVAETASDMRSLLTEEFKRIEAGGSQKGLMSHLTDLDETTNGFRPAELVILAARPSMGKCLAYDSEIVLHDGTVTTIEDVYKARRGRVVTLVDDWRLATVLPSDYIDDGVRPVFAVKTRLGRRVETTLSHPFLTINGWQPLHSLRCGDRIAIPRRMPAFGVAMWRECEVKLLAYLLGDGCISRTSPLFTNSNPQIAADFLEAVEAFGGVRAVRAESAGRAPTWRIARPPDAGRKGESPILTWLERLGLRGRTAHTKVIPAEVFKLAKNQIALFLNRLFATDGWATVLCSGPAQLGYCTVNEKLARQVQHLLLRFGIIAALKHRRVHYQNGTSTAWQLDITDGKSIETFAAVIGIHGKDEAVARCREVVARRRHQTNVDLIPVDIWARLAERKGTESWCSLARRAGLAGHTNIHVGVRALSRGRLAAIARALADTELANLADSDVYWDEIVSIEPAGLKQVYDLTIPISHNFVANDICVHNTSLATSIIRNVAITDGVPVCFYSLEMSKSQVVQNMLCSEARVNSFHMRQGRLDKADYGKLGAAGSRLSEAPIFIDDASSVSIMELRAKARMMKLRHGIGMIVIDYLQLMEGEKGKGEENRAQEISTISRGLKQLSRELNVPVIALSQLNRGVEQRESHKPRLSDLRESGSIEQDADMVLMLFREAYYKPEVTDPNVANAAEVIVAKNRNGPVGQVKLFFHKEYTRFDNWGSGEG